MSNAHKGSRLILKDQVIAVRYNSFHADYNYDSTAICYGDMIEAISSGNVYTERPYEGMFGGSVSIDQANSNLSQTADSNWTLSKNNYQGTFRVTTGTNRFNTSALFEFQPRSNISGSGWQVAQYTHHAPAWVSGNTYAWSIYARKLSSDDLTLKLINGDGTQQQGSTIYITGNVGQWQRLEGSFTSTVTSGGAQFYAYGNETARFELADPQIEVGSFAHAFTVSSTPDGKLWYPREVLNPYVFTISCWFYIPFMHSASSSSTQGISLGWYHPIIEYCPTSNRGSSYGISVVAGPNASPWNRKINLKTVGGVSADRMGSMAIQDKIWYHMALTYDGTIYSLYINGVLQSSYSGGVSTISPDTVLMVGGGYLGKSNILIDELYIDNEVAYSQDDIQAWYYSEKPFYNQYDKRSYAY